MTESGAPQTIGNGCYRDSFSRIVEDQREKPFNMIALALLQASTSPVIMPAPDPWPKHEYACQLVQDEAKRMARLRPANGERVSGMEQRVDCNARVVTRVITIKVKSAQLEQSAQRTADKFACSSPAYQIMYERDGWSFKAEFYDPALRTAVASARGKCEPLTLMGYQSPK